jgi:hypothetical protein
MEAFQETRLPQLDAVIGDPRFADIPLNPSYPSTSDRVLAFVSQGGGCRATFFNYRRRLGAPKPLGKGGLGK